jgi:hypothetical protein
MARPLPGECGKAFDNPQRTWKEARLEQENARLKQLVGELTVELKKSDRCRHAAATVAARDPA